MLATTDGATRSCAKPFSKYVYLSFAIVLRKLTTQVPDEKALRGLSEALEKAEIPHHLWVEEPLVVSFTLLTQTREHEPTALAIIPNKRPKSLKKILDGAGCSLWK